MNFPYPNDVQFRLPVGTYALDFMQLVSSSFFQLERACAQPTFAVSSAALTTQPVTLNASCP